MELLEHIHKLTLNPKNAARLKELVLELAVRGKLTSGWRRNNPNVEPATVLLEHIQEEKDRLVKEKKIKKEMPLPPIDEEEMPYGLPESWEWCRLGDLGDWGAGATPRRGNSEFYDGNINWYKSGELNNGIIDYASEEKVSDLGLSKTSLRLNKPGDVLIAMYGATIGKTGILNTEGTTNQAVCACTCYPGFNNNYLHLLLKAYRRNFTQQGAGGAQPNISKIKIRTTLASLPPLPEQQAIVEIVEQLMQQIEELEKQTTERIEVKQKLGAASLHQLTQAADETSFQQHYAFIKEHVSLLFDNVENIKKLRESILQLAVQGKLTSNWRRQNQELEPASVLLERIQEEKERLVKEKKIKKEKPLPPIVEEDVSYALPESWEWCRMQDLCPNISSGSTPPQAFFKEEGVPYLKVYNIKKQAINFEYRSQFVDKEFHRTKLKRSILYPGDVIMNIVGPPLGKIAIIPNDYPEWNCNQAIAFFKPLDPKLSSWLYTFLCAGSFLDDIDLIGTAGQDNISVTKSKNIKVPLPPFREQQAIIEVVEQLMQLCDALENQIILAKEKEESLMQAIIHHALEGKEEVPIVA